MLERFKIGVISIDKEGTFWVDYIGDHPNQGGIEFSVGNIGSKDVKALMKLIGRGLNRCRDRYLKEIGEAETRKEIGDEIQTGGDNS